MKAEEHTKRLGSHWGSVRGIIRDFTFSQIKDMVGAAGLPMGRLIHLHNHRPEIASKEQLVGAVDETVASLPPDDQDRFVAACIHEILSRRPSCGSELEAVLERVGWGLSGGEPYPLLLQIDIETTTLSQSAREGLAKALRRYRDGDASGAITAICGLIDNLTESVYARNSLGVPFRVPFATRVLISLKALEASFRQPFAATGIEAKKIDLLWQHQRGAVEHAAEVLGAFRREFSDAHGRVSAPDGLVQRALDCAVFLIRTIDSLL